jgi:hypothetical protein
VLEKIYLLKKCYKRLVGNPELPIQGGEMHVLKECTRPVGTSWVAKPRSLEGLS